MSFVLAYGDLSSKDTYDEAQLQGGSGSFGTIWGPKITNNLHLTLSDLIKLLGIAKAPVAAILKSELAKLTNVAATENRNISTGGTFRRPVSGWWTLKNVLSNPKMYSDFNKKGIQVTGFTQILFDNVVRKACEEHLKKKGTIFSDKRCEKPFSDALKDFHFAITDGLSRGVPHTLPVKSCSVSNGTTFFHVLLPFASIEEIEKKVQKVHFVNVTEIDSSAQAIESGPDYKFTVFSKIAFDDSKRNQTIELSDKSCGDKNDVFLFSRTSEPDFASIRAKMVCYRMPLNVSWFGGKLTCNSSSNTFTYTDEWWWGRNRKEQKGLPQKNIPIKATLFDFKKELDSNFKRHKAQFELNSSTYNLGMLGIDGVCDLQGKKIDLFPGSDFSDVEVVFR